MNNKQGYSPAELMEFKSIIEEKIIKAKQAVRIAKNALRKQKEYSGKILCQTVEDGAEMVEADTFNLQISRQSKFIKHLEEALIRIKAGSYGICITTGKLIDKRRLRVVPHTNHCIEAKKEEDL